ncbi:MAG: carboxylesterase family protein [Planctomycetota bacterium]
MRLRILLLAVSACVATSGLIQAQDNRPIGEETAERPDAGGDPETKRSKRGNRQGNKRGGAPFSSDVLKAQVMTLPASLAQKTKALSDRYMFFSQIESKVSKVPLIIYLHGGGGHRRDVATLTNSPIAKRITEKKYPFAVLIPQHKPTPGVPNGWQPDDLNLLIKHAVEAHKVDPERVFVTGSSMGGAGTWMLANKYPEVIAAAAPMAAGGAESPKGDLPVSVDNLKNVAIWAFHGDADKTCPHEKIQTLVKKIETAGGSPKFTLIPGGNHGATGKVYREDKLYEWFLQQK